MTHNPTVNIFMSKPATLHNDQRGAVMIMGLGMMCVLIGALWFMMGIGDAIIFRDTMQEATDHAAFTSAVIHAKGMNFIAACNMIILALIAVHIILGILHDIALAVCITTLFGCIAYINVRRAYTGYAKFFKPACAAVHLTELAVAYGFPFLGSFKGYALGNDYEGFSPRKTSVTMLVLSPSMMPGGLMDNAMEKVFGKVLNRGKLPEGADPTDTRTPTRDRIALPVGAKAYSAICDKITRFSLDGLIGLTGKNPKGKIMSIIKGIIGKLITLRYCNSLGKGVPDGYMEQMGKAQKGIERDNDKIAENNSNLPKDGVPEKSVDKLDLSGGVGGDRSGSIGIGPIKIDKKCMMDNSLLDPGFDKWWGCDGPLLPVAIAPNGSPWLQVWAINMHPDYTDKQERRAAFGERKFMKGGALPGSTAEPSIYFSEAEFYFDCKKDWWDNECNGDDHAGYSMRWRARLKRLQFPEIGTLLSTYGASFLTRLQAFSNAEKYLQDLGKSAATKLGMPNSPLATIALDKIIGNMITSYITNPVAGAIGKAGGYIDPKMTGVYH